MKKIFGGSWNWCSDHYFGGVHPCPWPDCENGIEGDAFEEVFWHDKPGRIIARVALTNCLKEQRYRWGYEVAWEKEQSLPAFMEVGNLVRAEAMRKFPKLPQPMILYHYTSLATLTNILHSNEFWLTDVRFLNDHTELKWGLELALDVSKTWPDELLTGLEQALSDFLQLTVTSGSTRVLAACFSTERDDLAQWRYYGDDGRGVAIGFDARELVHSLGYPLGSTLEHIIYDKQDQIELLNMLLDYSIQLYGIDLKNDNTKALEQYEFFMDMLIREACSLASRFKSAAFQSEREVRLISTISQKLFEQLPIKQPELHFRVANDLVVPYMRTSQMGRFSDIEKVKPVLGGSIVEVMVGYHPKAEVTRQGVEELLRYRGLSAVKVSRSAIPART